MSKVEHRSRVEYRSSGAGGGIGFFGVLFFIFLFLKLTEVIDWSWWWVTAPLWWSLWWVTAPLWIPLAIAGVGVVIRLAASFVEGMLKK